MSANTACILKRRYIDYIIIAIGFDLHDVCSLVQAKTCLKENDLHKIIFHGDSMSRDIFGPFMGELGLSAMSAQQLKELTNVKGDVSALICCASDD